VWTARNGVGSSVLVGPGSEVGLAGETDGVMT
jgi:hypothetical protein